MRNSKQLCADAGQEDQSITSRRGFLGLLTGVFTLETAKALQGKMGHYVYKAQSKTPTAKPVKAAQYNLDSSALSYGATYAYDGGGLISTFVHSKRSGKI